MNCNQVINSGNMHELAKQTIYDMSGLVVIRRSVFPLASGMILCHWLILYYESATHGFSNLGINWYVYYGFGQHLSKDLG